MSICDFLRKNGLGYISHDPTSFSENFINNNVKSKLQDQHIQSWDHKAKCEPRLNILYNLKKSSYKRSSYLSNITHIQTRKLFTKLRLICSKLNGHMFLWKDKTDKCIYSIENVESTKHFLLDCRQYIDIRRKYSKEFNAIVTNFDCYNNKKKF